MSNQPPEQPRPSLSDEDVAKLRSEVANAQKATTELGKNMATLWSSRLNMAIISRDAEAVGRLSQPDESMVAYGDTNCGCGGGGGGAAF